MLSSFRDFLASLPVRGVVLLKASIVNQGKELGARAWDFLSGIAVDYWKDGEEIPFVKKPVSVARVHIRKPPADTSAKNVENAGKKGLWHAEYPEILEIIWGKGHVLPCGDSFTDMLAAPVGLDKEKSVLDLSAGLGSIGRRLADAFGTYVTGLEPDQQLAEYGMSLSVQAGKAKRAMVDFYDPERFVAEKRYDCIIVRELFYKIHDKKRFFKEIGKSLKERDPRGHLIFTDYILEPDMRKSPAVVGWVKHEIGALPLSLKDMKKAWTRNGFDVRVAEDLTAMYRGEILKALAKFALFLQKHIPDVETKKMVFDEIEAWAYRVSAMDNGLKFYRFYAMK